MKKIELDSRNSLKIDNDLYYYNFSNLGNSKALVYYETEIRFIQFHFCLSGNLSFEYNNGAYSFPLQKDNSILLFNPSTNLPINVIMGSETKLISILISIKKFHSLFSETSDLIPFLSDENIDKKYYKESKLSPFITTILTQMLNEKINDSVRKLYIKGKAFELLSLYFNISNELDIEQCPFLSDDQNVIKIKKVKEIIISKMNEPPSLNQLADEVEISLKNLKQGFKHVYGNTVFGFLFDHKMNTASKMLSSKNYNVNEVAHHLGYSTASHFITAFKRKFGTTPKRYLNSFK
jgi:AraC-like DNA-binding protein